MTTAKQWAEIVLERSQGKGGAALVEVIKQVIAEVRAVTWTSADAAWAAACVSAKKADTAIVRYDVDYIVWAAARDAAELNADAVIAEIIVECMAECSAKHPTMPGVACMLRPGHKGCHRHHTESSSFAWGK